MLCFLSFTCFAQDDDMEESEYAYVFDNHQIYIMAGATMPFGDWKDLFETKTGFGLDFGTVYYLKRLNENIAPFGLGVDANYIDFSLNRFPWDFNEKASFLSYGLELGPLASYNLVDELNLDLFYRFGSNMNFVTKLNDNDEINVFVGWKHSVGLNVRYRALKLGLEADLGKLRHANDDFDTKYGFSAFEIKIGGSF